MTKQNAKNEQKTISFGIKGTQEEIVQEIIEKIEECKEGLLSSNASLWAKFPVNFALYLQGRLEEYIRQNKLPLKVGCGSESHFNSLDDVSLNSMATVYIQRGMIEGDGIKEIDSTIIPTLKKSSSAQDRSDYNNMYR
ncbi:MAG: hypothetical protein KGI06_03785 [Candidatus Micrarchaeota archaeon]|nr:hypothetical protein [Candidatus Micrarchaeota archaeon]